jgi:hypothetical protein
MYHSVPTRHSDVFQTAVTLAVTVRFYTQLLLKPHARLCHHTPCKISCITSQIQHQAMTGRSWTIYKSLNPPGVAHPASIPLNKLGKEYKPTVPHLLLPPYQRNLTHWPPSHATHQQLCTSISFLPAGLLHQEGCRPAVNSCAHSDQVGTPCLQSTESMHTRGPTQHTNSNKPCPLQHATGANGAAASAHRGQHTCNPLPAAYASI